MRKTIFILLAISMASCVALAEDSCDVFDYLQIGQIPQMIVSAKPCYPDSAYKERVEGAVLVDIIIGEDGKVISAKVADSEPPEIFDNVALEAALNCVFSPIIYEGKPVKVAYRIPFVFGRDRYDLKRCSKVKK